MKVKLMVAGALALAACGDTSGTTVTPGDPQPVELRHTELRCIYRETFGCRSNLELQLQFMDGGGVAYDLYFDVHQSGRPVTFSASEATEMTFGVNTGGAGYRASLSAGEIAVTLANLPEASGLEEGATVNLDGAMRIEKDVVLTAEGGARVRVSPQSVAVACASTFSRALCLD